MIFPARGAGSISLVVRHDDGRPAADTNVQLSSPAAARTDALGRVRFDNLAPGTFKIEVLEPGFAHTSVSVALGQDEHASVALDEAHTRAVPLLVVDELGARVPFAAITVELPSGVAYVDLDGDIQNLTLFTDAAGGIQLRHLPLDGDVNVTATFGSRRGSVKITALDQLAALRLESADEIVCR